MKHLIAVTGSSADWGLMGCLLQPMLEEGVCLTLVILGDHDVGALYETSDQVDLVRLAPYIGKVGMGMQAAHAASSAAEFFSRREGPVSGVVLLGDRVEIMAFAVVAILAGVPIHHLWAGDRSGCVDDYYRDAISMLSTHLYSVSDDAYRRTIDLKLAAPDRIETVDLVAPPIVVDETEVPFERYAVARWHPETTEDEPVEKWVTETISKAITEQTKLFILPPNTDDGWQAIDTLIDATAKAYPRWVQVLRDPMDRASYLGMLKNAEWVRGNSSSFLLEAPLVGQKHIWIDGNRQQLRHVPNPHGRPMHKVLLENVT